MEKKIEKSISKFLSLVLRHKPEVIGLTLDNEGWTNTEELITKYNENRHFPITFEELDYVVQHNNKKRFAFNEDQTKIRASQGHSLEISLNYDPVEPPEFLYHGTAQKFLDSIQKTGIEKRNRHHVHLAADLETALNVGSRHGKPVILKVHALKMHANGQQFFCSENGVWLTTEVAVTDFEVMDSN